MSNSNVSCRHDEQAAHAASINEQFGNTQQALQELQAEFADQQHAQSDIKTQLELSRQLHAELLALHTAQSSELVELTQQLSSAKDLAQDLQVLVSAVWTVVITPPGIALHMFTLLHGVADTAHYQGGSGGTAGQHACRAVCTA